MGELWRARKWRKLLNLIDQLPRWSLFEEAKANDLELALQFASLEAEPFKRRFSEWTPLVEAVAALHDLMAIFVAEKRTSDVAKFPRPRGAWDDTREVIRQESYDAAIAFLFPDGYK